MLVHLLYARRWLLRLVFLAGLATQLTMLVLTFSRGGWLGLFGATGLMIVMIIKKPVKILAGLLIFAVLLAGLWNYLPTAVHQRFSTIFQEKNSVNIGRLYIWKQAKGYIADSPVWGSGPNNKYNTAIPFCVAKHYAIYHCHNWGLYILVELGVVGAVILFLYLGLLLVRSFFRLLLARGNIPAGYYGVFAGLAGFMFHNQVDYFLWQPRMNYLFWLNVLLLVRMNLLARSTHDESLIVREGQPV
jgi:putative inorganic carbon (HCO3(-)) transporter